MDAHTQAEHTAGMDTKTKTVEELLAQARDITQRALGRLPDAVLAEVFRQLCVDREYQVVQFEGVPEPMH